MVFYQAAAPTSWTQDTTQNNKALRVVSGTGAGTGGVWDLSSGATTDSTGAHVHAGTAHTHSTPAHSHTHTLSAGAHTLTIAEMPSHSHFNGMYQSQDDPPSRPRWPSSYNTTGSEKSTGSTGGGGSHSHSLAGTIDNSAAATTGSSGAGDTSSAGGHTHTISAPKYVDVIVCSKD
jgi:hypothetical protein